MDSLILPLIDFSKVKKKKIVKKEPPKPTQTEDLSNIVLEKKKIDYKKKLID